MFGKYAALYDAEKSKSNRGISHPAIQEFCVFQSLTRACIQIIQEFEKLDI